MQVLKFLVILFFRTTQDFCLVIFMSVLQSGADLERPSPLLYQQHLVYCMTVVENMSVFVFY